MRKTITTTTQTDDVANIPHPTGAVRAEDWEPAGYRVFVGERRYINDSITARHTA